jgi:hypothetical protein
VCAGQHRNRETKVVEMESERVGRQREIIGRWFRSKKDAQGASLAGEASRQASAQRIE